MPLAQLTLSATAASVSVARHFLADTLQAWAAESLEWAASQVLSELATNAVIHAGTSYTVALLLDGDRLRIEVRDGSQRVPRQRHYGMTATTGRGLALVGALTSDWGISAAVTGKTVWCVLGPPDEDLGVDLDAFLTDEDRMELGPA